MKKAFTLVELLIVIGIIAILGGVMLSALSGSSESAKAAKCLSNMHALGMGVLANAMTGTTGAGGRYPIAGSLVKYTDRNCDDTEVLQGWIGWKSDDVSSSYISAYEQDRELREDSLANGSIWSAVGKNSDCYVCPLHRETFLHSGKGAKLGPCWSYVMNAALTWSSQTDPFPYTTAGAKFQYFKNKNKTLLLAELPFLENDISGSINFNTGASKDNDPVLQYSGCDGDGDEVIAFNHKTGKREIYAHVCFADGHTEKLILPRGGSGSNIKELTKWLCEPSTGADVVLEGNQYKKLEN